MNSTDSTKAKLFKYEICSYNGIPTVTEDNNEIKITCKCKPQFTQDKKLDPIYNNYKIDCSYKLKSKLKTLFFACIIPFGLDYYYLDYIFLPYFIFIINLIIIIINIYYINKLIEFDKKINYN